MTKKLFIFISLLIFSSSTTWSAQSLLSVSESCGRRGLSRAIHFVTRSFSNASFDDKILVPERRKTMQVFSRPTYDRIAKYVLSQDETVRIDILKAFTGISSLSSATQLDEHYNPFDPLHNLRKLINSSSAHVLFETIRG